LRSDDVIIKFQHFIELFMLVVLFCYIEFMFQSFVYQFLQSFIYQVRTLPPPLLFVTNVIKRHIYLHIYEFYKAWTSSSYLVCFNCILMLLIGELLLQNSNFGRNMHKNALFLLKTWKNSPALRVSLPDSLPPAAVRLQPPQKALRIPVYATVSVSRRHNKRTCRLIFTLFLECRMSRGKAAVNRSATKILLREGIENRKNCDVNLMTYFGDIIFITS